MPPRTVERVTKWVMGKPPMSGTNIKGKSPKTAICESIEKTLCEMKTNLINYLNDDKFEDVLREKTDLKTIWDMSKGAMCKIKCR